MTKKTYYRVWKERKAAKQHTHTQFCFCFVQLELARAFTARSYTHSRIHPSREEAFWYTRWTVQPHTWNTTHAAVYASFSAKHTPKSATANCVVDSVLRYSLRSAEILGHHLSFVRALPHREKNFAGKEHKTLIILIKLFTWSLSSLARLFPF